MEAKLNGDNSRADVFGQPTCPSWTVAIFTARETITTLASCIQAVLNACESRFVVIDVLVNGNRLLADAAVSAIANMAPESGVASVRVWFIQCGDKAHTWNEYIHRIWQRSEITYFIDGYAIVMPDAFGLIDAGLSKSPKALGASGVPTSGRSAAVLRKDLVQSSGIHGNLYAIRGSAIASMRESAFRLPLGLYRTDPLIGAVLKFRLDPAVHKWESECILVQPDATWSVATSETWTSKMLAVHFNRKLRQAQGYLENRAAREHLAVRKLSPQSLPKTISELVNSWIKGQSWQAAAVFIKSPLSLYAAFKLRQPRDWSSAEMPPLLLHATTLASVQVDVA